MKVSEIPIGHYLNLGYYKSLGGDGVRIIQWAKADGNNGFLATGSFSRYPMDVCEPNNESRDRRERGSNFFPQTNLCQFLNAIGKDWYQPQHEADEIGTLLNVEGFLTRFDEWERNAIVPHEITTVVPNGFRRKFGDVVKTTLKVSIPSASQIFGGADLNEGNQFELYASGAYRPKNTFTRTAFLSGIRITNAAAELSSTSPCTSLRFNPYIQVDGQMEVEYDPTGNCYCLVPPESITNDIRNELNKILI